MEEPHRIFIPIEHVDVKEEFFEEEQDLGEFEDEQFSDKIGLLSTDVGKTNESGLQDSCKMFMSFPNTVIKQEFSEELMKNEHDIDNKTDTLPVVKEEIVIGNSQAEDILEKSISSATSAILNQKINKEDNYHITGNSNGFNYGLIETNTDSSQKYESNIQYVPFRKLNSLSEQESVDSRNASKPYECDECNKTFTRKSGLSKHKLIHRGIRRFECDVCNKNFTQKRVLNKHKAVIHSSVKEYECDICNKTFSHESYLSIHQLIHTGIKQYVCDICNKAFTQKGQLSRHNLIHIGLKKYECEICNKTFIRQSNLSVHKLIHSGVKKFQCDVCSKAFTLSSNLSKHKLIHSGVKKYQCDICYKNFTLSGNLETHKLIHSGIKEYKCEECNKHFTQKSSLLRHLLSCIHNRKI